MSSTELKLTAVWTGKAPPPSRLKLSDYTLPLLGDLPEGYFHALYGNRAAYGALGEILPDAQKRRLYFSTAMVTVALSRERKTGVVHLSDLNESTGGLVNLSRASKEVVAEVAAIYREKLQAMPAGFERNDFSEDEPGNAPDWRKPFRFMPENLALLPDVFDLLQCEVLVHPVRFDIAGSVTVHHIASMKMNQVNILDATPNRFEVGPHPDLIEL